MEAWVVQTAGVAGVLTTILAVLQNPIYKGLILNALGYLFSEKPAMREAIPVITLGMNVAMSLVVIAGEAAASPVAPAGFALAAVTAAEGFNPLLDVLLPQIIADGAYNWPRKLWKWLKARLRVK